MRINSSRLRKDQRLATSAARWTLGAKVREGARVKEDEEVLRMGTVTSRTWKEKSLLFQ